MSVKNTAIGVPLSFKLLLRDRLISVLRDYIEKLLTL